MEPHYLELGRIHRDKYNLKEYQSVQDAPLKLRQELYIHLGQNKHIKKALKLPDKLDNESEKAVFTPMTDFFFQLQPILSLKADVFNKVSKKMIREARAIEQVAGELANLMDPDHLLH